MTGWTAHAATCPIRAAHRAARLPGRQHYFV